MIDRIKALASWMGRKFAAFLVTVVALILVSLIDKAAAAEIGWCLVGAFGVFAGANSAITIGRKETPKTDG